MLKLLKSFIKYPRYYSRGKSEFIEEIKKWSGKNLDRFNLSVDSTRFSVSIKEIIKILLLSINSVILIYLIQDTIIYSYFSDIVIFLFLFPIQFRLIFALLSIIIPSKNIILSKNSKNENNTEIIITAHYDTKNSLIKRKKGIVRSTIKRNIYAISRLATKYLLLSQKMFIPLLIVGDLWYMLNFNNISKTVFLFKSYPGYPLFQLLNIIFLIIFSSVISAIIMWIINLPFVKNIKNSAVDDNTSGVVGALEIAKKLNNVNLDYDMKVVLFDNEEKGLVGSTHFVNKYLKGLRSKNSQVINLDCISRGSDIYILTENKRNNYIYNATINVMESSGVEYKNSNMDFSDHKSFLKEGINAISIGRYNSKKYLWVKDFPEIDWIHGSEDDIEGVDIYKINQIVDIVIGTIKSIKKV